MKEGWDGVATCLNRCASCALQTAVPDAVKMNRRFQNNPYPNLNHGMQNTPESEHTEANEVAELFEVVQMNLEESAAQVKKAAYWFYVVAALSIINIFLQERGTYFIAGLAFPSFINGFLAGDSGEVTSNYFVPLACAATFIFFGYFGARQQRWAFIAGAVVYVIDAAIYAFVAEWLALAFHLFILYKLFQGFRTIGEYEAIRKK